jgi:hypothetical protein
MQFLRCVFAGISVVMVCATGAGAQETVSYATTTNREAWRGETSGSQAGLSLDRGDVSAGDSRRDLIVGAPAWGSNTGRVYVVFSGAIRGGEQSLGGAHVVITGVSAGDRLGEATAAGFITAKEASVPLPNRDLVVGAPGVNGSSGAVYMYLRGLAAGISLTPADATLTVTGAPAGAKLGAALATGDLDGDGYREIMIGAPGVGAVYVIHGGPSVSGTINLAVPSSAFFKIQGSAAAGVGQVLAAGDLLGHATAGNNTIYDLAIGAPFENGNAGAVYVVVGRTTASFPAVMNLPVDADARFGGIDAGDEAGKSILICNVDKDKFADLVVGAAKAAGPGNSRATAGELYVVWGAGTVASRALSAADVTIYGAAAGFGEGTQLAYGDVTRDGTSDFVSLAPGASTAGDIHLFNGKTRASWPSTIDLLFTYPDRRLIGDPSHGTIHAAAVWDLTGEGFDDIAAAYPSDVEGLVQISFSLGVTITDAPFSHTINPDVLTTFSAGATGSPLPTPQWQVSTDGTTWTNIPGATATTYSFLARASDNGKRYRAMFSSSVNSAPTGAAILTVRSAFQPARRADFDGDGVSDVVVWRPSTGTWYALTSSSGFTAGISRQWGNSSLGDKVLSGDMDGDGIVDLIVWRPTDGVWYWLTSGTGYNYASQGGRQWGNQSLGDIPMLGDMDGDGKSDLVIWRASTGTWYWLSSSTNYSYVSAVGLQWGNNSLGDKPLIGDFDGDGMSDLAVWRASNGTWYWLTSSTNYSYASAAGVQWGNSSLNDVTLTGDLDGDHKTDLIIWRPSNGTWYWLKSSAGYSYAQQEGRQWGNSGLGDQPMIGDFDGDGRGDLVVWRQSSGTWYWLPSSGGFNAAAFGFRQWGATSDIPVVK